MSNLKVNQVTSDKWLNSDGTENFKIRAWVSFNGAGTLNILDSGNVASVVDNGTGWYTVKFAKPMKTANYCAMGFSGRNSVGSILTRDGGHKQTTGEFEFTTRLLGGTVTAVDSDYVYLAFVEN